MINGASNSAVRTRSAEPNVINRAVESEKEIIKKNSLIHSKSTDVRLFPETSFYETKQISALARFFCGHYEAPEARPWVFMHCVIGICVVHFSISIAQEILYTAASIADENSRLPMLFNIRAGNAQIVASIIVSIVNFLLLPIIGTVCDYTRFRYHVGSFALGFIIISEFVSAAPSEKVHISLIAIQIFLIHLIKYTSAKFRENP